MTDLRTWAFQSPKRLGLLIGVPIVGFLLIASLLAARGDSKRGTDSLASTPNPSTSISAQVPNAQPFVTAALHFVQIWARLAPGQSSQQWHDAVRALATPDFATYLDQVGMGSLPNAIPTGHPTVLGLTAGSAIITVPLSSGRSVSVSVLNQGNGAWLVDDIEPATGN